MSMPLSTTAVPILGLSDSDVQYSSRRRRSRRGVDYRIVQEFDQIIFADDSDTFAKGKLYLGKLIGKGDKTEEGKGGKMGRKRG